MADEKLASDALTNLLEGLAGGGTVPVVDIFGVEHEVSLRIPARRQVETGRLVDEFMDTHADLFGKLKAAWAAEPKDRFAALSQAIKSFSDEALVALSLIFETAHRPVWEEIRNGFIAAYDDAATKSPDAATKFLDGHGVESRDGVRAIDLLAGEDVLICMASFFVVPVRKILDVLGA